MEIKLSTHFNKMTRDSKKELLQFHVTGEIENEVELNALVGEVVEIKVHELESLTAEFKKNSKDAKRTVLEFIVNPGKSNKHSFEYFSHTGKAVALIVTMSDMDIEEFHEGMKVKVAADGTAEVVDENQTTIEQFVNPMDGVGKGNDDEQEDDDTCDRVREEDDVLDEETQNDDDENDDL